MDQKRCYGCMRVKGPEPFCTHCGFDERTPNAPHQLPAGTVLKDQYLIGKTLGQGGFGITYLGWDRYLDIPVAVKEYYPNGVVQRESARSNTVEICTAAEDTRFQHNLSRFLQEAKALAKFRNIPEIVHIHNIFRENGTAYIIMEYVAGITLKEYVRRKGGRLGAQETFALLRPVIEGLGAVHQAGLVHRDISPDNIMLLPSGGAKLLDFGAAREVENPDANRELTRSTEAILKHGFAPMEQYQRKGSLGPWTDIYALCATVYYCLTGSVPADAPQRMMEEIHPDWDSIPDLSPQQRQILEKGMELRAKDRPASVAALCRELFGPEQDAAKTAFEEIQAPAEDTPAVGTILLQRKEEIVTAPVEPVSPIITAKRNPEPPIVTAPVERRGAVQRPSVPVVPGGQQPVEVPSPKKRRFPVLAAVLVLAVILAGGFFTLKSMGMFGGEVSLSGNVTDRSEQEDREDDASAADTPAANAPAADAPAADAPAAEYEELSLVVWCDEEEVAATEKMIESFAAAHPEYGCSGIQVVGMPIYEAETNLFNDPDLAADVLQLPSGSITAANEAGLLLPITVDMYNIQSLYGEGAIRAVTRYNEALDMDLLYGIPYSPSTWFMYYNNTMFSEEDVQSLEKMMAMDLGSDVYNFSCAIGNSWYIEAFFYAAGCNVFGPNGDDPTQCDWNSPKGLAAANYIYELSRHPKYLDDNTMGLAAAMMKEGRLGALCSGAWSYPELYEAMGDTLSACALPTVVIDGEEGRLSNFADYSSYCVKSSTAHPLAAQQLAAWLCNEESQLIRYREAGTAPCAMSLLETEEVASNVAVVGLMMQTEFATSQPSIPKMDDYWGPAQDLGLGILDGRYYPINLQSALNNVVNEITG